MVTTEIFILENLVEKSISIGKSLYVHYIDFRRAFDNVNLGTQAFPFSLRGPLFHTHARNVMVCEQTPRGGSRGYVDARLV